MSMFPILGPEYQNYNENDRLVLQRMEAFYANSITMTQAYWAEADTDTRYEAGDATLWQDLWGNVPIRRRRQFTFNRIRPIINMIDGYQRRNRKSIIAIPVENADQATADQYTKALLWIQQQENILETISTAFHGSLVTGLNFLQVWNDWGSDPISGNIKVDCISYNQVIVDPYFKKADMSDCSAIWVRKFYPKRTIINLLPDSTDKILAITGNEYGSKDPKFQFMPETYNYYMKNLLTYDEFNYRSYRNQKMLIDVRTGECTEWRGNEDDLKYYLRIFPEVTVIEQEIPTVRQAIIVQGRVMYDGPHIDGLDTYSYIPVMAYYHPEMAYYPWRIQGVVRNLRDPQFLYNHRKIIEMDILESVPTSGFFYKENALVNPNDIYMQQGQGKGIAIKSTASMADVAPIPAPSVPPSMMELSQGLAKELTQISGVNEELLGSAIDDKAGILSMLRQGAGLTTLQILFDQLDQSQRLLGRLILKNIQTNWAPGKIKKVLQEEPTKQFRDKAFGVYDVSVVDGFNTSTQKQMEFAQLLQLRELGVPVTDEDLIDKATLQGKDKLIENMQKKQQQAAQIQQQQAQVAMQEQAANINLLNARADADRGLGIERASRLQENVALAEERRAEAILNFVKALKEIESIDISHIKELIALEQTLKATQQEQLQPQGQPQGSPLNKASALPIENNPPVQNSSVPG